MLAFSTVLFELYPGLTGADLRAKLKDYAWKGHKTLGYTRAREEMYGYIYNDPDDQAVYCIYTGLRMSCKYDSQSTGCNSLLNCEHTVPQSFFGKSDPMVSDIHHLRGTWSDANGARSNYPFKQLADKDIDKWYGNNKKVVTSKPNDPENWSALEKNTAWMPRDAQKGDTARAIAYFYTVYPTQAGSITKVIDVDTMIDWDESFAPSELQNQQYLRAVEVQGNKNPYQEERHLVARAYCDQSSKYNCADY